MGAPALRDRPKGEAAQRDKGMQEPLQVAAEIHAWSGCSFLNTIK